MKFISRRNKKTSSLKFGHLLQTATSSWKTFFKMLRNSPEQPSFCVKPYRTQRQIDKNKQYRKCTQKKNQNLFQAFLRGQKSEHNCHMLSINTKRRRVKVQRNHSPTLHFFCLGGGLRKRRETEMVKTYNSSSFLLLKKDFMDL